MKGKVEQIDYETAVNFLLPKHYSGRKPVISKAFGWYLGGGNLKPSAHLVNQLRQLYAKAFVEKNTHIMCMN